MNMQKPRMNFCLRRPRPRLYWSTPGTAREHETAFRHEQMLRAFLEENRLFIYRYGRGNLRRLLAAHGADDGAVQEVLDAHFAGGCGTPMLVDHGVLLGRGRIPRMLIGHPRGTAEYVAADSRPLIDALTGLGLRVEFRPPEESFYDYRAVQVHIA
jgi:hypothetical protein